MQCPPVLTEDETMSEFLISLKYYCKTLQAGDKIFLELRGFPGGSATTGNLQQTRVSWSPQSPTKFTQEKQQMPT